jgi:hypothetical protein
MTIPEQQTFRLQRRGYLIAQALLFLVFTISCLLQAIYRQDVVAENFLTAWWFFALLSAGFAYLTVEAFYKLFFTRLVFIRDGFILYDFLKVTRLGWNQVKRVGEISVKGRRQAEYGLVLKESARKPGDRSASISLASFLTGWNDSPIRQWLAQHKSTLVKKT